MLIAICVSPRQQKHQIETFVQVIYMFILRKRSQQCLKLLPKYLLSDVNTNENISFQILPRLNYPNYAV